MLFVRIDYTNHKGIRGVRCIAPQSLHFGSPWHGNVWVIRAKDASRGLEEREFPIAQIHAWEDAALGCFAHPSSTDPDCRGCYPIANIAEKLTIEGPKP